MKNIILLHLLIITSIYSQNLGKESELYSWGDELYVTESYGPFQDINDLYFLKNNDTIYYINNLNNVIGKIINNNVVGSIRFGDGVVEYSSKYGGFIFDGSTVGSDIIVVREDTGDDGDNFAEDASIFRYNGQNPTEYLRYKRYPDSYNYNSSITFDDLCLAGNYLYAVDDWKKKVWKIKKDEFNVVSQIDISHLYPNSGDQINTIAFDGEDFWLATSNQYVGGSEYAYLYRVTNSFNIEKEITLPSFFDPVGLAWNPYNESLYLASENGLYGANCYIYRLEEQEIFVTQPNGGETYNSSNTINIRWDYLLSSVYENDKINISFTSNGGTSWEEIGTNIDIKLKQWTWNSTPNINSSNCLIKLVSTSGFSDISDNTFEIITNSIEESLTLLMPNGGEKFNSENDLIITWDYILTPENENGKLEISFSSDDGNNWDIVSKDVDIKLKEWTWTSVPTISSQSCYIKINTAFNLGDISDNRFEIYSINNNYTLEDDFVFLDEYGRSRYYISNFTKTWTEAKLICEVMNGHLVTISSKEENNIAFTGAEMFSLNRAWIGFTDEKEEGVWEWVTGEEIIFTNWYDINPNNNGGFENYAIIYGNETDKSGKWNDNINEGSNGNRYFILEIEDIASSAFYEDFEDNQLHEYISIQSTGTFNENPAIKEQVIFGSTKAYGFGISDCSANCFDSYVTDLKITFPSTTYVENFTFKEIELYGDWGSKGHILVDNVQIDSTFGSKPGNDNVPDTNFKLRNIPINKAINSITIRVRDITNQSEIFIDDLNIYFGNDISEGLIAYYPFNGNANDESGNGNHGIVNGATLSMDRFGNPNSCYNFDGVNDFIVSKENFQRWDTWSMSVWVYANEINKRMSILLRDKPGDYYDFGIQINSNNVITLENDKAEPSILSAKTPIIKDSWINIITTYNGSTRKIYINSVLENEHETDQAYIDIEKFINIGSYNDNTGHIDYFDGKIDDIAIYNKELNDEEIVNIYQFNSWDNNLIAYYPFNGNANDESGNKFNGTNNGADYSTDRFNNENSAMYFDGVDDYIELPDLPLKAFPFSISFAMNATEKKRHYVYTSDKWDRYWGDYEGFNIAIDENGAIFARYGNNGNDANITKTSTLPTLNGEWNIISIVFEDYHDIKIYFNGQIQQTTESQPNLTSIHFSNKNDKIGAGDDNRHNFHGYLDDFYFFDRILTEEEVKNINLITNIEDFVSKNTLKSSNYLFHQNYPNPFNPNTKISYSIPENGLVLLTIYDVLGNVVEILENSFKNAGTYSYSFNAKNLSSGIYFYTIRVNNFVETKKMLLVK